jgi:hypothetical protein
MLRLVCPQRQLMVVSIGCNVRGTYRDAFLENRSQRLINLLKVASMLEERMSKGISSLAYQRYFRGRVRDVNGHNLGVGAIECI